MEERGNKTIICSVFFLDIVEYSKKSVSGQISLKERFNAFLSTAIRDVPVSDRIILDTGDGAAISFLGDVEDALRAALSMRDSLMSEESGEDPPLLVRMGVNLGPVRLVRDINGQPNIVGDGINVAQRVMGFAEPGQILVSRSYYDAASRLSQEYAGMFHYVGSRTDKHVREHEVYAIGDPGGQVSGVASQPVQAAATGTKFPALLGEWRTRGLGYWDTALRRGRAMTLSARDAFQRAPTPQKALYVGIAAIPVLLLLLIAKLAFKSDVPPKGLPVAANIEVPVAQSAVAPAAAAGKPVVAARDTKQAPHPKPEAKTEKKEKKAKPETKATDKSKAANAAAGTPGVVMISVKPWGEVYLDGKMIDVSPPLTRLQVPVGTHLIELKNANFPVYRQSVRIKAGEKISINHKFAN